MKYKNWKKNLVVFEFNESVYDLNLKFNLYKYLSWRILLSLVDV